MTEKVWWSMTGRLIEEYKESGAGFKLQSRGTAMRNDIEQPGRISSNRRLGLTCGVI